MRRYSDSYRLTGSAADADDIVQACFLELLRPNCSYDPDRAPLRNWLFGVARNHRASGDATGCIDFEKIGLEKIFGCWPYARPMHMLLSSYNAAGSEVVLSWSDPGHLEAWLWSAKLAMFSALDKMHGVLSPSNGEEDDHTVFHSSSDEKWTIEEKDALLEFRLPSGEPERRGYRQ